jgi:starvation-inducible DNA-binding protein
MDELKATLRVLLANHFVAYFKAQTYHWNVEGVHFPTYHDFFGDLYKDYYGEVDTLAEYLRILGEYAPASLMEMYNYKTLSEDTTKPDTLMGMIGSIGAANQELISNLNKLFDVASAANEQGIADYAAGKLDAYKKHAWMIRSCLKNGD